MVQIQKEKKEVETRQARGRREKTHIEEMQPGELWVGQRGTKRCSLNDNADKRG